MSDCKDFISKQDEVQETVALGFSIEAEGVVAYTRLSPIGHYNKGFYSACDEILSVIQSTEEQGAELRKILFNKIMELRPNDLLR